MAHDVFISYSSKDQKIVEALSHYLEERNIRCFVAYRDIPKGKVWAAAITEAIENSQMMIVIFSKDFNLSPQVDREIELGSEENKPILTFRIQEEEFAGAKKYYLKNLNWIDAFPNPELCFANLFTSVEKLIGKNSDIAISHDITTDKSKNKDRVHNSVKLIIKYECPFGLIGPDLDIYLDGNYIGKGNYIKGILLETVTNVGVHKLEIKGPILYKSSFDFYIPENGTQLLVMKNSMITGKINFKKLTKIG